MISKNLRALFSGTEPPNNRAKMGSSANALASVSAADDTSIGCTGIIASSTSRTLVSGHESAGYGSGMATSVSDLDLPELDLMDVPLEDAQRVMQEMATTNWLARNPFGYTVLRYEDVAAILRDKRWHNAAAILPQMAGV